MVYTWILNFLIASETTKQRWGVEGERGGGERGERRAGRNRIGGGGEKEKRREMGRKRR